MIKKTIELTHRSKLMEVKHWNGVQFGQETTCGLISWTKNGYHESQSFYVREVGNEKRKEVTFAPPFNLSKVMRKEVGKKLETLLLN